MTGTGTVKQGAVVDVTAAPRSVIDGSPTGGTVTATFSGELSAEPMNTRLDADASFVYAAPAEQGNGTLTFEARSRRCVGKGHAEMHVDETNYIVSGSGPEITFSGTVRDFALSTNFYATGTFSGGTAEFYFSADLDAERNRLNTGVVTITGGGNGVTLDGTGTFTLVGNADGTYTVTMQESSCVHVPGPLPQEVCRDHTENLTLTPEP